MDRPPVLSRLTAAIALGFVSAIAFADSASAHVKWFCAYNVAGQPIGLEQVLCPDFEYLVGLSALALMTGALIERTGFGIYPLTALGRVTHFIEDNTELMFRAGGAFFFIAIWGVGGIILTPELKIDSTAVGTIQLIVAVSLSYPYDHFDVRAMLRGPIYPLLLWRGTASAAIHQQVTALIPGPRERRVGWGVPRERHEAASP